MAEPDFGQPKPDPILSVVKPGAQPADGAGGSPNAGRTTVNEAKRKGPIGFLQLLGPGLITGASDDDPSGIGTYSQVGSQFGYGLLWLALFTFPLMSAVQELCARIALQTGVGLGASLRRKFPRWLVGVAILGLLAANTFNVGADLGAVAAAGSLLSRGAVQALWLVVPVALVIIVLQVFASYATIFKLFKWLTLALFGYVVTAFFVFSVGLIGAGLLAIPILSGSATYAIKEFLGLPGSLASKPQQRPTFYIILTLATVAGVVMNFMHLDPIRALFLSAVINGVVAPPLLLLIVLLGRDPAVMKRYVSGTLSVALTAIATTFMAVAAIAMFATMFTGG